MPGSYRCECLKGFQDRKTESGYTCSDVDECDVKESVCGVGGDCLNTVGSFNCLCDPGFSNYGNNQSNCTEIKCERPNATSKETEALMGNLLDVYMASCESLGGTKKEKRSGETLLKHLLNVTGEVILNGNLNSSSTVTAFFDAVEGTMRHIAPQLSAPTARIENNNTEAWLTIRRDLTPPTGHVMVDTDNVQLNVSWESAVGDHYPGYAYVALVSYKSLNSTKTSIKVNDDVDRSPKNATYHLNSQVVTVLVGNTKTESLPEPVMLTFKHLQKGEVSKGQNFSCVYWDKSQNGGSWSVEGCVKAEFNSTHATCTWTHMSSFAVLMALYPVQDSFQLVLITRIGLTLSLVCLLLCILTFFFCRTIKGTRTTIHLNLCLCLFIANFIFLFFISSTHNRVGCALVAALLHFFYLSAFCFMLLEGVQLYRMLVRVFNTTFRPLYLFSVGYGLPLAVVIISAIAFPSGYGTERHCWLSLERDFIWSFLAPVCIIIFLNSVFFVITIWKLVEKASSLNPDVSKLRQIRRFVLTAVAQLCVLGGMWVFGCFLFQEQGSLVMAYLFTLLNTLQGALIFIMHCLLSKQVREEYKKLCVCKPEKKRYSEFSTNQSSNSQQPLRSAPSTRESEI